MLALLLGAAFVGLGYRLVDLQVIRHEQLSAKAEQNTFQEASLEPRRGDILDVRGNVLATSTIVKTVCADPGLIGDHAAEVARGLAPLLQKEEAWLAKEMAPRFVTNTIGEQMPVRRVKLKDFVPPETWSKIQVAMKALDFGNEKKLSQAQQKKLDVLRAYGVFAESYDQRVYPNDTLAAHVLGFARPQEQRTNGRTSKLLVGQEGIEASFDGKLRGTRGWRVTERDSKGRELVNLREQEVEPNDGLNVVLTIDSVIQHIVETALAEAQEKYTPISISGIVVRPRTGQILAMATLPTFDPNNIAASSAEDRRNRVITDVAEPGSTFKIVVVSGALNDHTVVPSDTFDCEHGNFTFAGHHLRDHEGYGVLSVEKIITKSSNIGAAKIGIKMGESRLLDYIRDFGFGQKTLIPLPSEAKGIVEPKKWTKVSIAQIPMGHGVAVTRLQMIMAMCAIANNGLLMRPMLVDRLEDQQHNVMVKYTPQEVRRVLGEPAVKQMVAALKTVTSPDGTAPKAALEHYTVAGKTGTAQKAVPGGYSNDKFFSSFVGFFPADNPELCISITIDEPKGTHYGGQTAAPIFKRIAEKAANYLNIRPEDGAYMPPLADAVAAPSDNHLSLKAPARPQ